MARTKTTSKFADDENSQVKRSPSPPQNTAADQTSDQQPLNETLVHTILPNVIIPAFDTLKSSKPKSYKKPIIKPRPVPTRRSQRMKKSSKEPKVSHVNLVSDEEQKINSNSEEKDADSSNEEEKSASSDDEMDETYEMDLTLTLKTSTLTSTMKCFKTVRKSFNMLRKQLNTKFRRLKYLLLNQEFRMCKLLKPFKLMKLFKLWKMLQVLKKLKQLIRMLKVLSRINSLLIKILIKMLQMNLFCQQIQYFWLQDLCHLKKFNEWLK